MHDNFNETIIDWDIAVVSVDTPFEFDNSTKPVQLPEKDAEYNDNWATVIGYGSTSVRIFIYF